MSRRSRARWPRVALAIALLLGAGALTAEYAARAWVEHSERGAAAARWRDCALGRAGAAFRPHPYLLYVRNPAPGQEINSGGFFGPEWALERIPGRLRIACLGGASTESGNAEGYRGSYPFALQQALSALARQPVEVLDCGISGWTSAEILLAWLLRVQSYHPDLIVLHEALGDAQPRSYPDFRADYSHYRKSWEWPELGWLDRQLLPWSAAWLRVCTRGRALDDTQFVTRERSGHSTFVDGRFPPGTEQSYRRNFDALMSDARLQGVALLAVTTPGRPALDSADNGDSAAERAALREHNQILRELAAAQGALVCDLERMAEQNDKLFAGQWLDLARLQPAGNATKARAIAEVLAHEWAPLKQLIGAREPSLAPSAAEPQRSASAQGSAGSGPATGG